MLAQHFRLDFPGILAILPVFRRFSGSLSAFSGGLWQEQAGRRPGAIVLDAPTGPCYTAGNAGGGLSDRAGLF